MPFSYLIGCCQLEVQLVVQLETHLEVLEAELEILETEVQLDVPDLYTGDTHTHHAIVRNLGIKEVVGACVMFSLSTTQVMLSDKLLFLHSHKPNCSDIQQQMKIEKHWQFYVQ